MNHFAKAVDRAYNYHYLSADSKEEIKAYCERKDIVIQHWASNVTPIMASFHFKWVGKRSNPFVIAKPIYKYEAGKYIGRREFKEKF